MNKRYETEGVEEPAYIAEEVTQWVLSYNPKYGDDRVCKCGHAYYRHFDSHDCMAPVGCKYCECISFEEAETKNLLVSLHDHNKMMSDAYDLESRPRRNGISCPACGEGLFDTNPTVLLGGQPPMLHVTCEKCGYTGYRLT